MQLVTSKINSVCLDFLNNQKFENMCTELSFKHRALHPVSVHAIRNGRRKMEDRHVVVQDLNTICYIRVGWEPIAGSNLSFTPVSFSQTLQDEIPTSYYAVFDGHAGTDAAFYAASQLHFKLVNNANFLTEPRLALKEAFLETDKCFINKIENEVIWQWFHFLEGSPHSIHFKTETQRWNHSSSLSNQREFAPHFVVRRLSSCSGQRR